MKKIINWVKFRISIIGFYIGIGISGVDKVLKSEDHSISEKNKKNTRKLHSNDTLEKFYAGKADEKYTQQYYEILKKADLFMKKSTARRMAEVADRFGMSLGREIIKGEKVDEHFGFFDEKHINAGKTLEDALKLEIEERRTKDDDLTVIHMVDNKPYVAGIVDGIELALLSNIERARRMKFPISIVRENDEITNKLEMLTEFLHVKRLDDEHSQVEFFINNKFKINTIPDDNDIFKEIINIKEIWFNGKYDDKYGFNVLKFLKRYNHNDTYEVLKFFVKNVEIIEVKN